MPDRSPRKKGATTRASRRAFRKKAAARAAVFSGFGPTDNWHIPVRPWDDDFESKAEEWGLCKECGKIDLDWATERELDGEQSFNLCSCNLKRYFKLTEKYKKISRNVEEEESS